MYNPALKLKGKEFMTTIIMGVAAGAIAAVAERADAIATGGSATPFGYINTYMWILVAAVLFGPLGAIITTETQALIGLVTFANPLSWLWPFINPIFAASTWLVILGISKIKPQAGIKLKLMLMSAAFALLDIPLVYLVMVIVLGLPFAVYFWMLPVYIGLQLVPATFLAYLIVKAILRSKILGNTKEVKSHE